MSKSNYPGYPLGLACASALLVLGCLGPPHDRFEVPEDFAAQLTTAEESSPLGGVALAHRKQQLQRAHRDMIQFHTTFASMVRHHDRNGVKRLSRFVDAYMGLHLNPMLRNEWQSNHPELMGLDANLRLVKADVLIRMRSTDRAQRVLDEVEDRFRGREDMLVEYPVGSQNSLADGVKFLREGKWKRWSL